MDKLPFKPFMQRVGLEIAIAIALIGGTVYNGHRRAQQSFEAECRNIDIRNREWRDYDSWDYRRWENDLATIEAYNTSLGRTYAEMETQSRLASLDERDYSSDLNKDEKAAVRDAVKYTAYGDDSVRQRIQGMDLAISWRTPAKQALSSFLDGSPPVYKEIRQEPQRRLQLPYPTPPTWWSGHALTSSWLVLFGAWIALAFGFHLRKDEAGKLTWKVPLPVNIGSCLLAIPLIPVFLAAGVFALLQLYLAPIGRWLKRFFFELDLSQLGAKRAPRVTAIRDPLEEARAIVSRLKQKVDSLTDNEERGQLAREVYKREAAIERLTRVRIATSPAAATPTAYDYSDELAELDANLAAASEAEEAASPLPATTCTRT